MKTLRDGFFKLSTDQSYLNSNSQMGRYDLRRSYLPTHLLLFGRVDLDVLAERARVCVAFGAAGDLTRIWFLKQEIGIVIICSSAT